VVQQEVTKEELSVTTHSFFAGITGAIMRDTHKTESTKMPKNIPVKFVRNLAVAVAGGALAGVTIVNGPQKIRDIRYERWYKKHGHKLDTE
jgi:hypothetical protein